MDTTKPTVFMVNPALLIPHHDRNKAGTTLPEHDGKYQFIKQTIEDHGIEDALKVQAGTNVIIGGHTRHRIALELGLSEVPVAFYEVDDDIARYMMVVDNHKRIGDEQDPMKLAWTFKIVVDKEGFSNGGNRRISERPRGTLKSLDELATFFGMKRRHFIRYLSLLRLIPALQLLVTQQKISVKAGSILAQLSPERQEKVFQNITPEAFQAEYRLTENEVKNFADIFKSDASVGAPPDDDDSEDSLPTFGSIVQDVSGADKRSFESPDDTEDEEPGWQVTPLTSGGFSIQGGGRDMAEERLNADAVLDEPEHKKYLDQVQQVDDAHAIPTELANAIYDATRDVTRMVLRIDDEDGRIQFAQNQLLAILRKQLATISKIDLELLPLRVLVGDHLQGGGQELWQELAHQLSRVTEKVRAVSRVAVNG